MGGGRLHVLFENDLFRRRLEELYAEERAMIRRSAPPAARVCR